MNVFAPLDSTSFVNSMILTPAFQVNCVSCVSRLFHNFLPIFCRPSAQKVRGKQICPHLRRKHRHLRACFDSLRCRQCAGRRDKPLTVLGISGAEDVMPPCWSRNQSHSPLNCLGNRLLSACGRFGGLEHLFQTSENPNCKLLLCLQR